MAELAAFGIAVNVVQLIDFSSKVLATGRQLYTDGNEKRIGTAELKMVTEQYVSLMGKIDNSSSLHAVQQDLGESSATMNHETLTQEARKIAEELLRLLRRVQLNDSQERSERLKKMEDLRIQIEATSSGEVVTELKQMLRGIEKARPTRWESFRSAFLVFVHKDEIIRLEDRLNRIRRQLNSLTLVTIWIEQIEKRTTSILDRSELTNQSISWWGQMLYESFENSKVWQEEV
ncbi:MAG: hypothetical protein Q9165_008563, partial [Trypethelium subeluteriae]